MLFTSPDIYAKFYKVLYVLILSLIFAFIYMLFDDIEFGGKLDIPQTSNITKIKNNIFDKYKNKYKNFLTRNEFIKLPIIYYDGKIIINPDSINNNPLLNNIIFDIYKENELLSREQFIIMPIQPIQYYNTIHNSTLYKFINRLYYSITTQTPVGYGDIYANSLRVRLANMMQALSTVFIVLI